MNLFSWLKALFSSKNKEDKSYQTKSNSGGKGKVYGKGIALNGAPGKGAEGGRGGSATVFGNGIAIGGKGGDSYP